MICACPTAVDPLGAKTVPTTFGDGNTTLIGEGETLPLLATVIVTCVWVKLLPWGGDTCIEYVPVGRFNAKAPLDDVVVLAPDTDEPVDVLLT